MAYTEHPPLFTSGLCRGLAVEMLRPVRFAYMGGSSFTRPRGMHRKTWRAFLERNAAYVRVVETRRYNEALRAWCGLAGQEFPPVRSVPGFSGNTSTVKFGAGWRL